MLQATKILLKKFPHEFTIELLAEHIDDLFRRFKNTALDDTIFRVGATCSASVEQPPLTGYGHQNK